MIPRKSIEYFGFLACCPDTPTELYRHPLYHRGVTQTVTMMNEGFLLQFDYQGHPAKDWVEAPQDWFQKLLPPDAEWSTSDIDLVGIVPRKDWLEGRQVTREGGGYAVDAIHYDFGLYNRRYLWILSEIEKHIDLKLWNSDKAIKAEAPGLRALIAKIEVA